MLCFESHQLFSEILLYVMTAKVTRHA